MDSTLTHCTLSELIAHFTQMHRSTQLPKQKSSPLVQVWLFLNSASLAFISPYLYVYFVSQGLNSAQLGIIAGLRPWVSAVSSVGWSALADRSEPSKYHVITWNIFQFVRGVSVVISTDLSYKVSTQLLTVSHNKFNEAGNAADLWFVARFGKSN